ncbi:MAG: hypothetical protein LUD84_01515 [Clostridiales bacterium]|nr:hypothetical protein [Clostridiales bacterium]
MKPFAHRTHYVSVGHWFTYNGKWVALAAIILLLGIYLYHNNSDSVPSDYIVTWVGCTELTEEEEEAVTAAMEAAGADENGDGEVVVTIRQFVIDFRVDATDEAAEETYYNTLKLLNQLNDADSYLFLLDDPKKFQFTTGVLQYLDGVIPGEEDNYECENWADMCVAWSCEGFERTAYLGRRALFEEDADYEVTFPGGNALFTALTGLA